MIDKLKSIFTAIGSMLPNREKRKEKFFASARTSERTDKDGNKILMVEEIDDVDYRIADHLDEVAEVEQKNSKE
jgi:hypothetical protein